MSCRASPVVVWIALVAVLLSMLPPAGAHHGPTPGFGADSDLCSTAGAKAPTPGGPVDHDHRACSQCDGCTGGTGHDTAPPTVISAAFVVHACAAPQVALAERGPASSDVIAAPPRGPPAVA